jgi:biotin carboxylase
MIDKNRILLFPAGPAQKEAFLAAKELGMYIVAVDRNPDSACRPLADEFYELDPGDAETLAEFALRYHSRHNLSGVLVVGCDIPVSCAMAAKAIGSPGISVESASLTIDKYRMKQTLREKGVAVPDYFAVENAEEVKTIMRQNQRRMIIKPNDNSGARGILQITPDSDIDEAFAYAARHVKKQGVILEVFEEGPQISTEALVIDGKIIITGFADRNYEYLSRYFPNVLENGATLPSALSASEQMAVNEVFKSGIHALGINNGVAKGDMVFTKDGPKVIEIAGRISGGKFASMIVPESNGVRLLHAALQAATGQIPDIKYLTPTHQRGVAVRYMFPPPGKVIRIEGEETARQTEGLLELIISGTVGCIINPMASHADRAGWVVCAAQDRETAIKRAETAINHIHFVTEPV